MNDAEKFKQDALNRLTNIQQNTAKNPKISPEKFELICDLTSLLREQIQSGKINFSGIDYEFDQEIRNQLKQYEEKFDKKMATGACGFVAFLLQNGYHIVKINKDGVKIL